MRTAHHPPAEQQEAEEQGRDTDEREVGALPGDRPQHLPERDRREPHAHAGGRESGRPAPGTGGGLADGKAHQERPRGARHPGQAFPGVMVGAADHDEGEHAAHVGHRAEGSTHGPRLAARPGVHCGSA